MPAQDFCGKTRISDTKMGTGFLSWTRRYLLFYDSLPASEMDIIRTPKTEFTSMERYLNEVESTSKMFFGCKKVLKK